MSTVLFARNIHLSSKFPSHYQRAGVATTLLPTCRVCPPRRGRRRRACRRKRRRGSSALARFLVLYTAAEGAAGSVPPGSSSYASFGAAGASYCGVLPTSVFVFMCSVLRVLIPASVKLLSVYLLLVRIAAVCAHHVCFMASAGDDYFWLSVRLQSCSLPRVLITAGCAPDF